MRLSRVLWALAVGLYGFGDTITTMVNLREGMIDLNPLINARTVVLLKVSVFCVAYILYAKFREDVIPVTLALVGLYGVVNNTMLMYGLP